MDIALAQPELIYPRGAEKQLSKLAYNLIRKGHSVSIYTFEKSEPYIFDNLLDNCNIQQLKKPWKTGNLFLNYPRWYRMCKDLVKLMGNHEVLNCHNFPVSWTSNFTKLPTVWMCNEPPGLYSYMQPLSRKNIFKKPLYPLFSSFDKRMVRRIRRIACLDSRMKALITGAYPKIPITITGSAAELEKKIKHEDNGVTDILLVAALDPHKRPTDIIEAVGRLKGDKIRVHYVGEGELKEKVKARAVELGVDAVFHGNVSDEKLFDLYSIADLAVFVPEAQPWGIFPLEAILAEIPTVISDECGVRDVLTRSIPVVKTGDTAALAEKISNMIDAPDDYREGISENKKIIEKNYSWEAYSEKMLALFKEAAGG
ncbi:glycosyltransferase family 4 protein [Candidatus Micrarchaeota archaeon]|nr:glycosyltransferase family 4 protein [Candidatus Micrarchaeota archaeon]